MNGEKTAVSRRGVLHTPNIFALFGRTVFGRMQYAPTLTAIISLSFLLSSCNDLSDNADIPAVVPDTVIIIHTNDHHGAIYPSGGLGGLSRRAEFVKSVKEQYRNVLILDAGDINTGGVLSNMFKAEPDILAYNSIGYDAVVLGNHEFDNPPEVLRKQAEAAEFKFLSANIKTNGNGEYPFSSHIIKDFGNTRVAVVGITTSSTPQTSAFGKQFVFENEISAARRAVDAANVGAATDLIILLTHVGTVQETPEYVSSITLADSVPGIDLIIDGHSHTRMQAPVSANGVNIVSAFESGKEVGMAKFIVSRGDRPRSPEIGGNNIIRNENGRPRAVAPTVRKIHFEWKSVQIDDGFSESSEINAIIKPFADSLQKAMGDSIAVTAEEFAFLDEAGNRLPRMGESAIGNLVCDAVMFFIENSEYSADFSLLNGGNIRAGLPLGKITREDVFNVLPFEGFVDIVKLSGKQIIELFDFTATIPQGSGGFAQVSKEVRYKYIGRMQYAPTFAAFSRRGVLHTPDLTIKGEEIDPEKNYFVATNDFLSSGGDNYTVFTEGSELHKTQKVMTDAVIEYLQSFETAVEPVLDGRIFVVP